MNAATTPKTAASTKASTPKARAAKPEDAKPDVQPQAVAPRRAGTPRRSISIASDPLDDAAVPAPAAAEPEPDPEPAPSGRRTASRSKNGPADPPMIDPGLRAGEESWDEETFKLTANIPKSLQRRINGVVIHSQMYGLDGLVSEEINSLTDFTRIALHQLASFVEERLHDGKPFPAPRSLPRGRR